MKMHDCLSTLVESPCNARARREIGIVCGRGLECIAEAAGERQARVHLNRIFCIECKLPLRERYQRRSCGYLKGRRRATGQVQQRAPVLLDSGDCGYLACRCPTCIEYGRCAAAKGIRTVECIGVGVMHKDSENLCAYFPGLSPMRVKYIFIDFEVPLTVIDLLGSAAASFKKSRNIEARCRGQRSLRRVFPCPRCMGFVK